MAIKDKNGNVVKLVGPNPLMRTQDAWDSKNVELINFGWEPTVVVDKRNSIKKFKSDYNIPDIANIMNSQKEEFEEDLEELEELSVDEIVEKEIVHKPEESLLNTTELDRHKVSFLCVLAQKTTVNDELYGDSYTRIVYGNKSQFPAIIIEQTDVSLEFWTEVNISVNSIVYPQDNSKRWWRVKSFFEKSGGSVVTAIISDVNPDFS